MVEKKLVEAQNMSQKDEEEDQQTHNQLIKYHLLKKTTTKQEIPNMTPIGTKASQKPTGTRKTRDM